MFEKSYFCHANEFTPFGENVSFYVFGTGVLWWQNLLEFQRRVTLTVEVLLRDLTIQCSEILCFVALCRISSSNNCILTLTERERERETCYVSKVENDRTDLRV